MYQPKKRNNKGRKGGEKRNITIGAMTTGLGEYTDRRHGFREQMVILYGKLKKLALGPVKGGV